MKKMIFAAMAAVMAACSSGGGDDAGMLAVRMSAEPDTMARKVITFDIVPEMDMQPMSRASMAELEMTDVWLFDYVGDELAQTIHQSSTDDGFGRLSVSLEYGEHHLCFVAAAGDVPMVESSVITWEKPRDTFWTRIDADVEPGSGSIQAVPLRRVATRLRIGVTDVVPEGSARLSVTPALWYYGIDVLTGEAASPQERERGIDVPASVIGTQGRLNCNIYGISPSESWQTDIDVSMLGSDAAVLGSVRLDGVSFSRNVMTVYSGGVLGKGGDLMLSADAAWGEDDVHEW